MNLDQGSFVKLRSLPCFLEPQKNNEETHQFKRRSEQIAFWKNLQVPDSRLPDIVQYQYLYCTNVRANVSHPPTHLGS
jgi:hypothetical protein